VTPRYRRCTHRRDLAHGGKGVPGQELRTGSKFRCAGVLAWSAFARRHCGHDKGLGVCGDHVVVGDRGGTGGRATRGRGAGRRAAGPRVHGDRSHRWPIGARHRGLVSRAAHAGGLDAERAHRAAVRRALPLHRPGERRRWLCADTVRLRRPGRWCLLADDHRCWLARDRRGLRAQALGARRRHRPARRAGTAHRRAGNRIPRRHRRERGGAARAVRCAASRAHRQAWRVRAAPPGAVVRALRSRPRCELLQRRGRQRHSSPDGPAGLSLQRGCGVGLRRCSRDARVRELHLRRREQPGWRDPERARAGGADRRPRRLAVRHGRAPDRGQHLEYDRRRDHRDRDHTHPDGEEVA